jgi:hypothetical protein
LGRGPPAPPGSRDFVIVCKLALVFVASSEARVIKRGARAQNIKESISKKKLNAQFCAHYIYIID